MTQPVKIAPDVCHISLLPRNAVNTYVIGSTLIDAGIRGCGPQGSPEKPFWLPPICCRSRF